MSNEARERARLSDRARLCDGMEEPAIHALVSYLEAVACVLDPPLPHGHRRSAEQFLLRRGVAFRPKPLPPTGLRLGMPKACFRNALAAARRSGGRLAYCEGFAWPAGLIAVHHAWVADVEDGRALEVTWPSAWQAERGASFGYVGLAFGLRHATVALGRSGCVLYDAKGGYPVVSGTGDERSWMHPMLPPAPAELEIAA